MVIFKLLSCKHAKVIKTHTEVNNHQRACRDSRDTFGAFPKHSVFFYVLAWALPFYFKSFQEWNFSVYFHSINDSCVKTQLNTIASVVFQLLQTYLFFQSLFLQYPEQQNKTRNPWFSYDCGHTCEFICNFLTM